jgi:O-antigen ligase
MADKISPGLKRSGSVARLMLSGESRFSFYLIIFYLFLEYARPQGVIPALSQLHLSAITAIILALSLVILNKFRLNAPQLKLYFALMILMVIHGPIAKNNYFALMIFITMTTTFIFCVSIANVIDNEKMLSKFIGSWVVIYIFLAIYGVLHKGTGIGAFLVDENDLCLAINMIIPFCFFGAVTSAGKKRIFYFCLSCLFLFVVILTRSRGGFVGLVAMLSYGWIRSKKKILMGFVLSMLVIFAVLVAPSTYDERIQSIVEEGTQRGTAADRIYIWNIGWDMFLDNPILGVGQGNFPYEFRKYEVEAGFSEGLYGRSRAGRAAHSIYFTLLPELGLVGVSIFLLILYNNFKDLKYIRNIFAKRKDFVIDVEALRFYNYGLAIDCSMVAVLVSGIFISALYYPHIWVLTAMAISLKNMVELKYGTSVIKANKISHS